MSELKLTEKEIAALRAIARSGERHVGDVAQALGSVYPVASRVVASLAGKGFVNLSRTGRSKSVSLSDTKHAQHFKRLLAEFGHMNLEHVLSDSSLEVLSHILDGPLGRKELTERSSLSDKTVKVALRKLRAVGVIVSKGRFRYALSERFRLLGEFITEFTAYLNQKAAERFAADSVILWQREREFIIRTEAEKSERNFFPTATPVFHQYGIELLLPRHRYYFHSPYRSTLRVEDIILHTLALDRDSTRNILSVLLLWEKNKQWLSVEYLSEEAEKYELRDVIERLEGYRRTEGEVRPEHFPSWREYVSRAKEYGLA